MLVCRLHIDGNFRFLTYLLTHPLHTFATFNLKNTADAEYWRLAAGPFYERGKQILSNFFQIGSEFCASDTPSFSSDFRPSVRMFALNALLESAMHEGVIQLFNSRSQSLQTLNSFTPGFQLQIPITQHLNYRLSLLFNSRSQTLQILTSFPTAFQLLIPVTEITLSAFKPTFQLSRSLQKP